ncbi:hypothetical protein BC567DRAFT_297492 [Phyllosticta citribraziliensis]
MATADPTPQTKCGPSGLLKLPPELVEKIASHLSPTTNGVENPWKSASGWYSVDFVTRDDFLTLRHTCRQMNDTTFSFFRRQYFTERVVKLQTKSLQELSQISAHPTLRRQVQKLKISPQFHDQYERGTFGHLETKYMEKSKHVHFAEGSWTAILQSFQSLRSSITKSVQEDHQLWRSGVIPALLARIMASLQGLHAVSYGNHNVSNPKLQRFDKQTAKLWVAARIQEIEGTSIEEFHKNLAFDRWSFHRHKGFQMVKAALIACGKTFSSLRFEHGSFLLRETMRESKTVPSSLLEQCFKGLKALHVSFTPIVPEYVSDTAVDDDLEEIVCNRALEEPGSEDAFFFLAAVPGSIEELELGLNIDPDEMNSSAEEKVFAATPVFDQVFTMIEFPRLRKLSIKNTFHVVESMAQLISKHKTSLRVVQISPSVPQSRDPEFVSYVAECGHEPGFDFDNAKWSAVLKALLECENLVDLRLRTQSSIYIGGGNILANRKSRKWRGRLWYAWGESYDAAPWVIEPRAKFLRERFEQHLEEWKKAERVHKV